MFACPAARESLFDAPHQTGFRLFNGFTEGNPNLVIDLYARTALIHNYAAVPRTAKSAVRAAQEFLRTRLPWLRCTWSKPATDAARRKNKERCLWDDARDRLREHGVWYALDLLMNRDASFYLDTRNLRRWASRKPGREKRPEYFRLYRQPGSGGVRRGRGARRPHRPEPRLSQPRQTIVHAERLLHRQKRFPEPPISGRKSTVSNAPGKPSTASCSTRRFSPPRPKARWTCKRDSARLINKVRPLVKMAARWCHQQCPLS